MKLCGPPAAEMGAAVEQHLHQPHHSGVVDLDLLLARDLKLIKPKDYAALAQRTIEVKRMLTALIQKLNADR